MIIQTQFNTSAEEQVREFMKKAGQACPTYPQVPPPDVRALRLRLIAEELIELSVAYGMTIDINPEGNDKGGPSIEILEVENAKLDIVEAYDATIDEGVVKKLSGGEQKK